MNTDRRRLLKTAAGFVFGARLARSHQAPEPAPAPKQAKITSSVMLWTLKGTFEQKLATAAAAGIQSIELVTEYESWSDTDATRYRKLVESYGMRIDLLLCSRDWTKRPVTMVNPAHREAFVKDVEHAIQWAKKLNTPQIILMSGNEQPDLTPAEQYASMVESGKRAAEMAQAADVTMVLENLNSKVNHKGYYLTSAAEALRAVKEVNHPHFRFLFDIYHEYVQHGDPIPLIKEAAPYVAVFHVADAPGRHDPGTGEMKWTDIYTAITKTNYAGYIALEYLPSGDDQVASLIKAVTDMRSAINAAQTEKPSTPAAAI